MDPKLDQDNQTVVGEKMNSNISSEENQPETSTGLKQNMAGMLCYFLGFITGIIFLLIEKENHFVRYHALQSIIVSVMLVVFNIVLTAIPLIGWLIGILLSPIYFILWIYMMWKAYQNSMFKLPIAGDMAEKQLKN